MQLFHHRDFIWGNPYLGDLLEVRNVCGVGEKLYYLYNKVSKW